MSSETFFNALADFIRSPVVETPPSELTDDALVVAHNVLKTVLDGRLSELRDELVSRLRARPSDEFGKRWLEIDEGRVSLSPRAQTFDLAKVKALLTAQSVPYERALRTKTVVEVDADAFLTLAKELGVSDAAIASCRRGADVEVRNPTRTKVAKQLLTLLPPRLRPRRM